MSKLVSFVSMVFLISTAALGFGLYSAHSDNFLYQQFKAVVTAISAQRELEETTVPPNYIAKRDQRQIAPLENRFTKLEGNSDQMIVVPGGPGQFTEVCGEPGCLAVAYDRAGEIAHSWHLKTEQFLTDSFGEEAEYAYQGSDIGQDIFPVGVRFFENGDLLVNMNIRNSFPYGFGLARVSPSGDVLWRRVDYYHHWAFTRDDGTVYSPYYEIRTGQRYRGYERYGRPYLQCAEPDKQYADFVHILSGDGEVQQKIDLIELIGKSPRYNYLLARTNKRCDPLHLNYIDVAEEEVAAQFEWLQEGDILLSYRGVSALMIISADGSSIKRVYTGSFAVQHSAQFSPDGRIYLFDNMGTSRESLPSRLLAIDIESGQETIITARSANDEQKVEFSPTSGNLDLDRMSARALISYTNSGRLNEVDLWTGDIVSTFENWHAPTEEYQGLYKVFGAWYAPPGFASKLD